MHSGKEAQLSPRGHAMLYVICIIEYFAKSLKVTEGHFRMTHRPMGRAYVSPY